MVTIRKLLRSNKKTSWEFLKMSTTHKGKSTISSIDWKVARRPLLLLMALQFKMLSGLQLSLELTCQESFKSAPSSTWRKEKPQVFKVFKLSSQCSKVKRLSCRSLALILTHNKLNLKVRGRLQSDKENKLNSSLPISKSTNR